MSPVDVKLLRANYAGNVTLIDDQIGEIFDTIDKRGELANTVIVFMSDHGEMNGDYGFYQQGQYAQWCCACALVDPYTRDAKE